MADKFVSLWKMVYIKFYPFWLRKNLPESLSIESHGNFSAAAQVDATQDDILKNKINCFTYLPVLYLSTFTLLIYLDNRLWRAAPLRC